MKHRSYIITEHITKDHLCSETPLFWPGEMLFHDRFYCQTFRTLYYLWLLLQVSDCTGYICIFCIADVHFICLWYWSLIVQAVFAIDDVLVPMYKQE